MDLYHYLFCWFPDRVKTGLLADIFLHDLETNKINNDTNPFKNKLIYWFRYVDDILCLFKGNEDESRQFLNYLNSLSDKIKFTIEIQNQKINFLDLTITNENNKHSFNIYRKTTQTDLIIPSSSNHPCQHKLAAFHSMIHRLINVPMKKENYEKEKNIIKQLATKNGYKSIKIEKMITSKLKKQNQKKHTNKEEKKEYICIPYNQTMNKAMRKTFDKKHYNLSYKTKNNTFKIIQQKLTDRPQQQDKYKKSGIYKIECSDCNNYYIGQTGRNFKSRFKEHLQALRTQNTTSIKSTFAEHLLETNHNYKNIEENMNILDYAQKGDKMNTKEDLYIYLHYKNDPTNMLNITHINNINPIFEKIRNLRITNHKHCT